MKQLDSVHFEINHAQQRGKFQLSILIVRKGKFASHLPASLFPVFSSVMHAYIFSVGMIHTAYKKERALFTSEDESIREEIKRLQED